MIGKYHDIRVPSKVKGVDVVLSKLEAEKKTVLEWLHQNPTKLVSNLWGPDSIIGHDDDCQCNLGKGSFHNVPICQHCTQLLRLVDLRRERFDVPFCIETGKNKGKFLECVEHEAGPYTFNRIYPPCTKIDKTVRYQADDFTIDLLGKFLISEEYTARGLSIPPGLNIITGFVCGRTPYTLSFHTPITEGPVTAANLPTIIKSIATLCEICDKYNMWIEPIRISIADDGTTVKPIFTIRSLMVGNTHIEPLSVSRTGMDPHYVPATSKFLDGEVYRVDPYETNSFVESRTIGELRGYSSYTFYMWMVVLLLRSSGIQSVVASDPKLSIWWRSLWHLSQLDEVLNHTSNINTFDENVIFLSDKWLNSDVIRNTLKLL